jgi:SPP1 family predicted phage head-tail adaptor
MQAGLLRKRVTLQQRSSAVEPTYGQQLLSWTDVATFSAEIEAISGAQLARSQSIYNLTTHHVVARYQPLFANVKQVGSYRIVYIGSGVTRYFDVGATMSESERNRMVTLLCSEGLNDGQ